MTYRPSLPAPFKSTVNISTTPLGIDAVFTGTGEQSVELPDVGVSCTTDQAGTLFFEFSNDNTVWSTFPVAGFAVAAGIHEFHTAVKLGRYFRVRYVNGGVAQTSFELHTYIGTFPKESNAPLNQSIGADSDATLTRSVIVGEDFDSEGSFNNVKTTPDGAIKTSITSAIIDFAYDSFAKVGVDSTTDRFDYYVGGLAGTKVADITIIYTDDSKLDMVSAERVKV